MTHPLKKLLLVFFIPAALFSCEKRYLEIVPVTEVVEDLSIPNGGNMKHFTFSSPRVCYAASDTNFLFKTTDGGHSWTRWPVNAPSVSAENKINALEFFDDQNGICIMALNEEEDSEDHKILTTGNGGSTWTFSAMGHFVGIGKNGYAYLVEANRFTGKTHIKESKDKGKTFNFLITLPDNLQIRKGEVIGSTVYLANERNIIVAYNTVSQQFTEYFVRSDKPVGDFVFSDQLNAAVVNGGIATNETDGPVSSSLDQVSGVSGYSYRSVDVFEGAGIAAGQNTLATNFDIQDENMWHPLLDKDGNSLTNTFYKVKFIDRNRFYVSGNNGLFRIMKI